ncbi:MAG: FCSD flavin-binding domain-containing protein, partial [Phenylobacterium sp.]|nr:FCSD flavin-binding domain-containing protein [Phenylobacterium sp.]
RARREGHVPSRRSVLAGLAVGAAVVQNGRAAAQTTGRVVVVGGGFGGATCARALKAEAPRLTVTLVEPETRYLACPLSNGVVASLRPLEAQAFTYDGLARAGVQVAHQAAAGVDVVRRRVRLADESDLAYDRLVIAPGVDLDFTALPGYDAAAAEVMPHAWKAGAQTILLRRQLQAMDDGGLVVMAIPANPYRCPPGPYERASLVAHYLKTHKPRSKLLLLDAKDSFSKQRLFEAAWRELYPGMIEWVSLSFGGRVTSVDVENRTLRTDFGEHRAAVANVIPPQLAGAIARSAGVADTTGWCPVDPVTFESVRQPGVHVIGDAAIGGAMPKSAFTANAQAKVCASAIVALMSGAEPSSPKLINTCYSLVAPDYGISIAGVYEPRNGLLDEVPGSGGVSPVDAPREVRALEATYAERWFQTTTAEVFG